MGADGATHFVRIATMLGAAFPDGPQMPTLAIELPWTLPTPTANLQAFIKQQQEG